MRFIKYINSKQLEKKKGGILFTSLLMFAALLQILLDKDEKHLLTGPVNLQEAKSLQPPFGSSVHLETRQKNSSLMSRLQK